MDSVIQLLNNWGQVSVAFREIPLDIKLKENVQFIFLMS